MCEAKPGPRCSSDTCKDSEQAAGAYDAAHPGGPTIDPIAHAETQFGFRPSAGMDDLIADELANHGSMVREAERKGREDEMPEFPTLATLKDSLDQMPDDIVADITGSNPDDVRAELDALIANHGDDQELEAMPSAIEDEDEDFTDHDTAMEAAGSLPPSLLAGIGHQTELLNTPVEGLYLDEEPYVVTGREIGDDVLDEVELAYNDGDPDAGIYVRGSVSTDLTALAPEGEDGEAWLNENEADVRAFIADTYGAELHAADTWEAATLDFRDDVDDMNDTVGSAALRVSNKAIPLHDALNGGLRTTPFATAGQNYFAAREATVEEASESYLIAAVWTGTTEDGDGEPTELDTAGYSTSDFHPDAVATARKELAEFTRANRHAIARARAAAEAQGKNYPDAQVGHDFSLTRNHHGAGFWDRGLGEPGEELTKAAHAWGEANVEVGDDGKLHFHG